MRLKKRFPYCIPFFFVLLHLNLAAQENCTNGKDDDEDGLIDLQDPDCQCRFPVSGNLLQNGSFESFDHCPVSYSFDADSKMVDYWQLGTYTNGNEAHYYHNFSCAYDSAQVMQYIPPALPLPDGEAFLSIRQAIYRKPNLQEKDIAKTYIGQCLQSPLKPGEQYTISFNVGRFQSNDDSGFKYKTEPMTVGIFGHKDCNAAPFGQPYAQSNGCPANDAGWILLGSATVQSKGRWVQSKINFIVPFDINVIEIGPDCSILKPSTELTDSTTLLDYYVFYLDDVHLLPTKAFQFPYIQGASGDPCVKDSLLKAPEIANASYQWYKDSIAILGATQATYLVPANGRSGTYNVRMMTNVTCLTSEPFTMSPNALTRLHVPADTTLCNSDTLLLAPRLNGVTYNLNGLRSEKVQVYQAGSYTIAAEADGCTRTFAINVRALDCEQVNFLMPNAFTPNGDGRNDVFRIPQALAMELKTFSIYDRWGNQVFYTTNSSTGWDGTLKGKNCPVGTYVYFIKGIIGNKERILKGVISLIR